MESKVIKSKHDSIFFVGDIHGNFKELVYNITERFKIKHSSFILCGDCGFGFEKRVHYECLYNSIKSRLEKNDIMIYCIRGNHDDKAYYTEGGLIDFERLKTVEDYTVITNGERNILCVGGAVSVDRSFRIIHDKQHKDCIKCWWDDEVFVFDEEKLHHILYDEKIQITDVATHTAPNIITLPYKAFEWINRDNKLKEDLQKEGEEVTKLYRYLIDNGCNIQKWFLGHYHMHYTELYNMTDFIVQDIQEITQL